jgi:hypothetical protein
MKYQNRVAKKSSIKDILIVVSVLFVMIAFGTNMVMNDIEDLNKSVQESMWEARRDNSAQELANLLMIQKIKKQREIAKHQIPLKVELQNIVDDAIDDIVYDLKVGSLNAPVK